MLNQDEDNIGKLPNDPLRVTAAGADEALLNFYRVEQNQEILSWQVKQKPGGVAGLSIGDDTGSRLFIESGTGKLAVGGTAPKARLDVTQDTRSGTHPAAVKGLYVTGTFGADSDGVEFRHTNGTQGIGFGYNTIYATGAAPDQNLGLKARGTGKVIVSGSLQVSGGQFQIDGGQKIAFSDTDTSNNLKIQLWSGFGLGINGSTLFYASNGQHSWRDANGTNERMLLTTAPDGGLTVRSTGASSFAGNLGIGVAKPASRLEVNGVAAVNDGTGLAVRSGYMAAGSLTLGSTTVNYGGASNWSTSTAGILLETLKNTEIAIHDSGQRLTSLMFYEGDADNRITIGRNMGYGLIGTVNINGSIGLGMPIPRTGLDTGTAVLSGAANDYIKAQFTLSGGGTVTWGGSGQRLKWTARFIAISMGGYSTFAAGHMNINQPTTDIPAAQVYDGVARSATADGVVLKGWEALYAVHAVGGDQGNVSFQIVSYTVALNAPSNWVLVAVVNDDDGTIKLGTGATISANSSSTQSSSIPRGVIMMWSGLTNNLPGGWALCDGRNSAPNLLDRFIVGAGASYPVGATGGANAIALTVDQMPSHNHNNGGYSRLLTYSGGQWTTGATDNSAGEPDIVHSADIVAAGGNGAHENRPPYYALAYIMKL